MLERPDQRGRLPPHAAEGDADMVDRIEDRLLPVRHPDRMRHIA
jgi:hypothetical protein